MAACGSKAPEPAPEAAPAAAGDAPSPAVEAPAPAPRQFVTAASRCGECHEKMFDEWKPSAHARAASSPLYVAARAAAAGAGAGAGCDRCHAPFARVTAGDKAGEKVAKEGVTCDVCHTLREPAPAAAGGGFRLASDDMVKYGPRCDLEDHYFHRMGCSPEHQQAELCGACHWWEPNGVPVLTEFVDWRDGPAGQLDKAGKPRTPCQGCHMPGARAALATGGTVRERVPHHGLLGAAGDLRARALALEVGVSAAPGDGAGGAAGLAVAVTVRNASAGHAVPGGLPERRLIVTVRVADAGGAEVGAQTRALGRVLVDASGAEVPFWKATRVASDTRIAAGGAWTETLALPAPATPTGSVEVDVVYRGLSDAAAKDLGVTEIEEHAMTRGVAFGGAHKLPRTVVVKPAGGANQAGAKKGRAAR